MIIAVAAVRVGRSLYPTHEDTCQRGKLSRGLSDISTHQQPRCIYSVYSFIEEFGRGKNGGHPLDNMAESGCRICLLAVLLRFDMEVVGPYPGEILRAPNWIKCTLFHVTFSMCLLTVLPRSGSSFRPIPAGCPRRAPVDATVGAGVEGATSLDPPDAATRWTAACSM